ncbi:polyamine aminopropyltransferase [Aquabacterium lacunae]|uniref:Polyamine aminopropyltransferase n=1 Tax=Aquabacterium lacunae TaxID=2528630 RepID=A0A4Q9GY80_9BURK|nr:polyamine aminopropyltransferase [Aquabacterium lacunae]TBO30332.1 polyamine aminopropyltransferase [Aquabacterium lacunae]
MTDSVRSPSARVRPAELLLLASVFVVAACGLVYELAAGALASYLLGDSILQFSTVIGTYLFAMGVGSWLSRHLVDGLVGHFLRIELMVGLFGGLMPAALFVAHAFLPVGELWSFRVLLYGAVGLIGVLVGLEIPLVMRILQARFARQHALKDVVSDVLTFDYLGALVVSLAFPLLLVPHLGVVRTGVFFGLLNVLVAVWALWMFRHEVAAVRRHAATCLLIMGMLVLAMVGAQPLTTWAEDRFYGNGVVLRESTPYQRIVLTGANGSTRLYLNGNLQFAARDEYRYHEALVHPAMSAHGAAQRVLVLGGGDGMAVREVLKHPSVQAVTLVELDPAMTRLFSQQPALVALNRGALRDPRVRVVNADAFTWLQQHDEVFDVIVIDFPDPTNHAIGKLYTTTFYSLVAEHLSASGFAVVQTTSPLIARQSFWTVASTLEAVDLRTQPYHVHVPSFGEWGFIVASHRPMPDRWPQRLPAGLKFLTPQGAPALFDFPPDMARVQAEPNRLSNQTLVHTFEAEWGRIHE